MRLVRCIAACCRRTASGSGRRLDPRPHQRRVDPGRAHAVHADAVRRQLDRERPGQRDERALRRRRRRRRGPARPAPSSTTARRSVPSTGATRERRADDVERPLEVDGQERSISSSVYASRARAKWMPALSTSTSSRRRPDARLEALPTAAASDTSARAPGLSSGRSAPRRPPPIALVSIEERDGRARARERLGRRAADPLGRAGDQDGLPSKAPAPLTTGPPPRRRRSAG